MPNIRPEMFTPTEVLTAISQGGISDQQPEVNAENWIFKTHNSLAICTDTRSIKPGDCFLALQGDKHDGHNHIDAAVRAGAEALIVSSPPMNCPVPFVQTNDTRTAYASLGRYNRRKHLPLVVGITGSNGKTSSREMLACITSQDMETICTEGNENNEIGVPKTLLKVGSTTELVVLEMAMRGLGEIAHLVKIAEPEIAMITNIGTAHIGRLGSRQLIAKAKAEIFCTEPEPKICFVPAAENLLTEFFAKTKCNIVLSPPAEVILEDDERIDFVHRGAKFSISRSCMALLGNVPMLIDVAYHLGFDAAQISDRLKAYTPAVGRGKLLKLANGLNVIDDTYNASPESVLSLARRIASASDRSSKVLIVGSIEELGDCAADLLDKLGEELDCCGLNKVVCIGSNLQTLRRKLKYTEVVYVDSIDELEVSTLFEADLTATLVGLKGSRAAHVEVLIPKLQMIKSV